MLIEPAELQQYLDSGQLRILDARSEAEYKQGHILGAVWVDVPAWQALGRTAGGFHRADAWAEQVSQLGIDHSQRIVVYGRGLPDVARIWWTLKYLGLKDVAILNGGWGIWTEENRPVDTRVPTITTTRFRPDFQADRLAEIDLLKDSREQFKVVDARSREEYTGQDVRGERGGHIPQATHLDWRELVAEDGRFKTQEQLQVLFQERGIRPDETAVCY